jgi:hypothetical protein
MPINLIDIFVIYVNYIYRDSDVIENGLDSPLDELENQSAVSEIPAYKSANQELAGVLKNLRKLEQHLKSKSTL